MDLKDLEIIPLEDIQEARDQMKGVIHKTPLIPLNLELDDDKKVMYGSMLFA